VEYLAPNRCTPMSEALSRLIECEGSGLKYKEFSSINCSGHHFVNETIKKRRRIEQFFTTRKGMITDFDCFLAPCRIDEVVSPNYQKSHPGDKSECTRSGELFWWVSCVDEQNIGAFQGEICRDSLNATRIEGEAARGILDSVSNFDCSGYGTIVETLPPSVPGARVDTYKITKKTRGVIYATILVLSVLVIALLARVAGFLTEYLRSTKYEKVSTVDTDTEP